MKYSFDVKQCMHKAALALLLLTMGWQANAQLGGGSTTTVWVGPGPQCDYETLQQAIDEIACGPFAPCSRIVNLSRLYEHTGGTVVLDKSIDFRGGWSSCKGSQNTSIRTELSLISGQAGPLFDIQPGSSGLTSQFTQLTMIGREFFSTTSGGVILMRPGPATLILSDSMVRFGNANLGGGIAMQGDGNELRLVDSLVENGTANFGGGISMQGDGNELRIIDSVVENGTAAVGGGIHCGGGGRIDFHSGEVRDNTAQIAGGGISLESGCELVGSVVGSNRYILNNRVSDMQNGQGAGIYATGRSKISMGALNSRTVIQGNEVDWAQGLAGSVRHQYDEPGQNRGGGVHLSFADATFFNTWFRENRAADGGAISIVGDSQLLVDRYPGPCVSGAPIKDWECSVFDFNDARGGRDEEGDEGGDGAVLYAANLFGQSPDVAINRSTIRFNQASCPGSTADGAPGECDIDSQDGGPFVNSRSSIFSADGPASLTFAGNLIHGNDIGDDEDSFVSQVIKYGSYFYLLSGAVGQWTDNTITRNNHADFVVLTSRAAQPINQWANNVVIESAVDEFGDLWGSATCNISNFASELQLQSVSTPIANRNLDPLFLDPDNSDPFQSNFGLSSPSSPAVDRCDDADGLATLAYDITGNPRPLNITNGPDQRDVGAFERVPLGYVNNTYDLRIDVESDPPKQADLRVTHNFRINVQSVGAMGVEQARVDLELAPDAQLASLSSPISDISGQQVWNCSVAQARCIANSVGVGSTITAGIRHNTDGLKVLQATVIDTGMQGEELTPDNNTAADTVIIGEGADLSITAVGQTRPLDQQQRVGITIRNDGPSAAAAENIALRVVATPTPNGIAAAAGDWLCPNPSADPCTFEGELLPGEESSLELLLIYETYGEKTIDLELMTLGDFTDPSPDNNQASVTLVLLNPSDELFSNGFESP